MHEATPWWGGLGRGGTEEKAGQWPIASQCDCPGRSSNPSLQLQGKTHGDLLYKGFVPIMLHTEVLVHRRWAEKLTQNLFRTMGLADGSLTAPNPHSSFAV